MHEVDRGLDFVFVAAIVPMHRLNAWRPLLALTTAPHATVVPLEVHILHHVVLIKCSQVGCIDTRYHPSAALVEWYVAAATASHKHGHRHLWQLLVTC